MGGSVKDYLLRELSRRDTKITIIKTTDSQDTAAEAKFKEIAESREKLTAEGILVDNCSIRAHEALDVTGLKGKNDTIKYASTTTSGLNPGEGGASVRFRSELCPAR